MLAWWVLVAEFRNLGCQWYAIKCIYSKICLNQDVSLLWESLHFDFLKKCFEMKLRGHQIKKPLKDFPFPSFPLLFLLFPTNYSAKHHWDTTLAALALCLRLSRWLRKPNLAQVTWQYSEDRGFLLPVTECLPAQSGDHSDLVYYFPSG